MDTDSPIDRDVPVYWQSAVPCNATSSRHNGLPVGGQKDPTASCSSSDTNLSASRARFNRTTLDTCTQRTNSHSSTHTTIRPCHQTVSRVEGRHITRKGQGGDTEARIHQNTANVADLAFDRLTSPFSAPMDMDYLIAPVCPLTPIELDLGSLEVLAALSDAGTGDSPLARELLKRTASVRTIITPEQSAWRRSVYRPGDISLKKTFVSPLSEFDLIFGVDFLSQSRAATDDAVLDDVVDFFMDFGLSDLQPRSLTPQTPPEAKSQPSLGAETEPKRQSWNSNSSSHGQGLHIPSATDTDRLSTYRSGCAMEDWPLRTTTHGEETTNSGLQLTPAFSAERRGSHDSFDPRNRASMSSTLPEYWNCKAFPALPSPLRLTETSSRDSYAPGAEPPVGAKRRPRNAAKSAPKVSSLRRFVNNASSIV